MSVDRVQRDPDIKIRSRMKELERLSKWRARVIKESDGDTHQALLIGHALLTELKAINKVLAETNKTLAAVYKEVSGEEFDWESCERRKAELFDGFSAAELKTMEGKMMFGIEDVNWGFDALDMTAYDNNGKCGNSGLFLNTKGAKREPYEKDNLSYKFADVKGTFEKGFITGLAYADQELIGSMLEDDGDGHKPKGKYAEALRDAQELIAAEIREQLWSILDEQECEEDGTDER